MNKPTKRLGRGLQSLISATEPEPVSIAPEPMAADPSGPLAVDINRIKPNAHQPRQEMDQDDLNTLAESIRQSGLIQPIVVRPCGEDRYELIAGERRWRACQLVGMKTIPVVIREANDQEMAELALVENIFREDLNAIERASAYKKYADEFAMSADQIAQRLGEDRTTVTNYMRLLDLPYEVKVWLGEGKLAMGHARCLLAIRSPEVLVDLAKKAIEGGLSVRALEQLVRDRVATQQGEPKKTKTEEPKRPQIRALEDAFGRSLSTKVVIKESRKKGNGTIVIHYYNLEDFDRVAAQLGVDLE